MHLRSYTYLSHGGTVLKLVMNTRLCFCVCDLPALLNLKLIITVLHPSCRAGNVSDMEAIGRLRNTGSTLDPMLTGPSNKHRDKVEDERHQWPKLSKTMRQQRERILEENVRLFEKLIRR